MKIDTLVLSGCSSKLPCYIGVFRYLFDSGTLNESLQGIKEIITCSIGMLMSVYLLLGVNLLVQEAAILGSDFLKVIDIDGIDINDLVFNLGLFDNKLISSLIKGVLREKHGRDDMTLKELYELNPIKLTVKCVNVTRNCSEYLNYETDPDLSILTLLQMTTAIPLLFKPIQYKGDLYVDGGLSGGYPVELGGNNYLGVNIKSLEEMIHVDSIVHLIPLVSYIQSLMSTYSINYDTLPEEYTINVISDIHFTNFNVPLDKKKLLIQLGYDTAKQHIDKYKIKNDNLLSQTTRPEDKDPTEED